MKKRFCVIAALLITNQAHSMDVQPQVRGYLDYASHHNDDLDLKDTILIRSARVGAKVDFLPDWRLKASYELASAIHDKHTKADEHDFKAGIKNFSVSYRGWRYANLNIGQYKLPFSLEQSTGSGSLPFIEASLVKEAFLPPRRLAIGLDGDYNGFAYAANAFTRSIDDNYKGNGGVARATYAFQQSEDSLFHLGAAFKHESIKNREDKASDFDAYPEVEVAQHKYVNTGHIKGADSRQDANVEAAWQRRSLIVQTEATQSHVSRKDDASLQFFGWHVGASWFLNGESYLKYKKGKFQEVNKIYRGGVWQLNARYSYIDLDDKDVRGGEQENFTLGLNYYINKNYRVMGKLMKVRSNYQGDRHSPLIGMLRLQMDY